MCHSTLCLLFAVLLVKTCLQVKKTIKDLEEAKQHHLPVYTEVTTVRNEVVAAQNIGCDRLGSTARLETMEMRYIESQVKVIKKHTMPNQHQIVITKVYCVEKSDAQEYGAWAQALVSVLVDGQAWSVDGPCFGRVGGGGVAVLIVDSADYNKFVDMWLASVFCNAFWKLIAGMGAVENKMAFADMAQLFIRAMDSVVCNGQWEAFFKIMQFVRKSFVALLGCVLPKPGICQISDVMYIWPSNASTGPINVEIVKWGRSLVQALRLDTAQFWTKSVKEFKQTVGAAEAAVGDFVKLEADLKNLVQIVMAAGFKIDLFFVEKMEEVLHNFAIAAVEWAVTLRGGALDDAEKDVKNVIDDVVCDLGSTTPDLKMRVLKSLSEACKQLHLEGSEVVVQRVCDEQLSFQAEDISNRAVGMVAALRVGSQVSANCLELATVITAKPALSEQAQDVLRDERGMCEAAIKGAGSLSDWSELKNVCSFFKAVFSSSADLSAEFVFFAKLFDAVAVMMPLQETLRVKCVAGEAQGILSSMSSAIRNVRSCLSDRASLLLPDHQKQLDDLCSVFIDPQLAKSTGILRPLVTKHLQSLTDECIGKIHGLGQVANMAPGGKRWAAKYVDGPILTYAEATILKVLQPPIQKLADEVREACN